MSHYHLELVRKLNLFHFVLLNKKNNLEKHHMVEIPNWLESNQLAIYKRGTVVAQAP